MIERILNIGNIIEEIELYRHTYHKNINYASHTIRSCAYFTKFNLPFKSNYNNLKKVYK